MLMDHLYNATDIHSTSTISDAAFAALGTGDGNVGVDLLNDHPVGVILDEAELDYQSPTNARVFSDGTDNYVECGSCHNAHNNTLGSFLRTTNNNSSLCLDCHIK
jgi:predicted CXXCH cytochrome family protein